MAYGGSEAGQPVHLPDGYNPVFGTELSPLLLQLHAACGDYMVDAPVNLATLEGMRSDHFLFLVEGGGTLFTASSHVYREGSPQHSRFMEAVDSPDTQVFVIHVRDIWTATAPSGEPMRGPITGDICCVRLGELQRDIKNNAVVPTLVDGRRHFENEDFGYVRRHIENMAAHQGRTDANPVNPHDLFKEANRGYMLKAPRPEQGLLRIPVSVAKEMLARGDSIVYQINESGIAERSKLESIKRHGQDTRKAYGVKFIDLHGFDKWAKRNVEGIIKHHQSKDRAKPEKNRADGL